MIRSEIFLRLVCLLVVTITFSFFACFACLYTCREERGAPLCVKRRELLEKLWMFGRKLLRHATIARS